MAKKLEIPNTKLVMEAWKLEVAERLAQEAKCEDCAELRKEAIDTIKEAVCRFHRYKRNEAAFSD